ncbi:MAG: universal stress protein [Magnetococcales bacterium]|nr:universal stress protein [Magnetococcales bacterium]
MRHKARILAVLDLCAHPQPVIAAALERARQPGAELRFVTLFDHAAAPRTPGLSSGEQFRMAETTLLHQLEHQVARIGAGKWPCTLLSGHPTEEITALASQWHATLIVSDADTARTLASGWFPWQYRPTPLPCPLQVVQTPNPLDLFARQIQGAIQAIRAHRA